MVLNVKTSKHYKFAILLLVFCLALYTLFAYNLQRTDSIKLITLYSALFFLFYKMVNLLKTHLAFLTWLAFIFRAIFILAIPNLSQDFYRFIWDGRMIFEGYNPYLYTVESFISRGELPVKQAQELYNGMGTLNASHFTNYPPINQLCFFLAALFGSKSILASVVVMRLIIIAADFGTLYFAKKLLNKFNMPAYHIFWYILNPFIIIELTGNLHFEGVMIFFLTWSLYLLHFKKWPISAIVFGVSISTKLVPIMFLPLFFRWFFPYNKTNKGGGSKVFDTKYQLKNLLKLIKFYSLVAISTGLLFLPFYSNQFIRNYTKTVGLWFQSFEFNASLYYIARAVGYQFRGYNEIAIIGKTIPLIVILFVLGISLFRKNKPTNQLIISMLLVLSFYYFTATTVHPWYLATLVILSVFTNYKFPLVWSFVIIFSYLAYLNNNNTETLWVIGLEYTLVYRIFIWEVFFKKKIKKLNFT